MAHEHSHDHTAGTSRTRLAVALGITASILVAEIAGAWWTGSLALFVDAGHMLTDAAGLLLALVAAHLTLRPPSARRTWGFRRAEVLAAGGQASILLAVGLYAIIEGIGRLREPGHISDRGLLLFGVIGLVGNLASMAVLISERGDSLNLRAAFLEVVNDALGSVAVIVAALVVWYTGWTRADAVAGMVIALLIIPRALVILKEASSVLLETAPAGLDLDAVRSHLLAQPHVIDVHDLHASRIDTATPVLSAHVVLERECFTDGHSAEMLTELQACVATHFPVSVEHSTFQLEPPGHAETEEHCAPHWR